MLDSTKTPSLSQTNSPAGFPDEAQRADPAEVVITDASEAAPYVNSVDATVGQPIVARVMARKHELEAALEALPAADLRARGDLELALGTVGELLTGDLTNVPAIVAAGLNQWLERNKHLAERAPVVVTDAVVEALVVDPITAPMADDEAS